MAEAFDSSVAGEACELLGVNRGRGHDHTAGCTWEPLSAAFNDGAVVLELRRTLTSTRGLGKSASQPGASDRGPIVRGQPVLLLMAISSWDTRRLAVR